MIRAVTEDASSPTTLEELARRAVAGDARALGALCRELEKPVFRLCLRMLGDVGEAEDATQDVLVLVVTSLSQFEGRSALRTWVHRIAARHVLARKKSRRELLGLDEASFAALLDAGLAFGASSPAPTPEDAALLDEVRLGCTQGMLQILSREERLALVLVDLLGFDGAEASDIVETGHDAFRQRLARARARLVAFLEARCGLVAEGAACSCARQLPAKKASGLGPRNRPLTVLSEGDLALASAREELAATRSLGAAFHAGGAFAAPASLRARLLALLPTLLGTDGGHGSP